MHRVLRRQTFQTQDVWKAAWLVLAVREGWRLRRVGCGLGGGEMGREPTHETPDAKHNSTTGRN